MWEVIWIAKEEDSYLQFGLCQICDVVLGRFLYVKKGYKDYGHCKGIKMCLFNWKNNFYDGLNVELGSGTEITQNL